MNLKINKPVRKITESPQFIPPEVALAVMLHTRHMSGTDDAIHIECVHGVIFTPWGICSEETYNSFINESEVKPIMKKTPMKKAIKPAAKKKAKSAKK